MATLASSGAFALRRENPLLRVNGTTPTYGLASHPIGEQATGADTLIADAAKTGSLSFEGTGANRPLTSASVKYIAGPSIDIRIAVRKVRDDVLATTGNRQEPFVYGSLGGENISLAQASPSGASSLATTAAEYSAAARKGSPEALRAFIAAHREGGIYVELARDRLDLMAASPSPSPSPIVTPSPSPDIAAAAPLTEAERCKAEGARLTALRNEPSADAISAFAKEMTCAALRPQLARLQESAGVAAAAPTPPPVTRLVDPNPGPADCAGEARELERLRAEPDPAGTRALYDRLTCAALRPQLQRLMESLGEAPANSQRAADPSDNLAATCQAEADELVRLLALPDRAALRAFSGALRCKALAPQVTRLMEGLSD